MNAFQKPLHGLWLSRELPFPPEMGDKIYSGQLAKSLADAGALLTFAGLRPAGNASIASDWPIAWRVVDGGPASALKSIFSAMPLVAAVHATPSYRGFVSARSMESWDFVVADQYALGWAVSAFKRRANRTNGPVLVHVAHNHETSVAESLYRNYRGSLVKRIALWQNYLKAKSFERKVVESVDLVTAITELDATKFTQDVPGLRTVVLKPGYSGYIRPSRTIDAGTPRRAVLVGSFGWIAKQENLRQFVRAADPVFAERGIEFQVIGYLPPELAAELARSSRATRIVGPVEHLESYFDGARIALVPEAIGGGFKLKFLDYIFNRVPVGTLTQAAAGLPNEILEAMVCRDSLVELAHATSDFIDNFERLNAMQEQAFAHAHALFRWQDRGSELLAAIRDCIDRKPVD